MRQLTDLEHLLRLMIAEHRKLLGQLDLQQVAMRNFRVREVEDLTALQESTRLRIATLEVKRRLAVQQIARLMRIEPDLAGTDVSLSKLARPSRTRSSIRAR